MTTLYTPIVTQPQYNYKIDWSNPLTKGLSFVAVGGRPIDLISGRQGTIVGTVTEAPGIYGKTFTTNTGAGNRVDFTHALDTGGSAYTFASIFRQNNVGAAFQYLIMRELAGINGGTYTILMGVQNAGSGALQISFGTTGFNQSSKILTADTWYIGSASTPPDASVTATLAKTFINGVKSTIGSVTDGGTVSKSGQTNLFLNGRPSDNLRQLKGGQALSCEWRRYWTDDEHVAFAKNPWQIFLPDDRPNLIFFPAGSPSLQPPLVTNSNAFYSPVVTGLNTLTASLYSNNNAFYSPVVTGLNTLIPSLYSSSNAFYSPVVTGLNTLTASLYSNNNAFYSPVVTSSATYTTSLRFYISDNKGKIFNSDPRNNAYIAPPHNNVYGAYSRTNEFYSANRTYEYTSASRSNVFISPSRTSALISGSRNHVFISPERTT